MKCESCDNEFPESKRKTKRFCSEACRSAAERKRHKKKPLGLRIFKCHLCSSEFESLKSKSFCSMSCYWKHYNSSEERKQKRSAYNKLEYVRDNKRKRQKEKYRKERPIGTPRKKYEIRNPHKYSLAWFNYDESAYNKHRLEVRRLANKRYKPREKLTDGYIRSLFRDQGFVGEVTRELIEEKKLSIKIKRIIHEKRQQINAL